MVKLGQITRKTRVFYSEFGEIAHSQKKQPNLLYIEKQELQNIKYQPYQR